MLMFEHVENFAKLIFFQNSCGYVTSVYNPCQLRPHPHKMDVFPTTIFLFVVSKNILAKTASSKAKYPEGQLPGGFFFLTVQAIRRKYLDKCVFFLKKNNLHTTHALNVYLLIFVLFVSLLLTVQ